MSSFSSLKAIDLAEIFALAARLSSGSASPADAVRAGELLCLLGSLAQTLLGREATIRRLKRLLFGPSSEARPRSTPDDEPAPPDQPPPSPDAPTDSGADGAQTDPPARPKRRGHGRLPASRFSGAATVTCQDPARAPHSPCPECLGSGTLYDTGEPSIFIKMTGQPIVSATRFERQVVRCSACQQRFRAPLPEGVTEAKWDPSADVALVLAKYAMGLPWARLQRIQTDLGIPLPASTQWERCETVADRLQPISRLLQQLAASAQLLTFDDTTVRILDLMKENETLSDEERRGMFTTGILAEVGPHRVVLFVSGRRHAGENITAILARRPDGLSPPITMADALSRNWPEGLTSIIAKCLTHGRRNFVALEPAFPGEVAHVLDALAQVYRVEALTRAMPPEERLAFHQRHSAPVLEALRVWIEEQLERAEPNGPLKKALAYLKKHWAGMTQFLRTPGAPLDSNAVERALKTAVLNRKNAYFYKSEHGAAIGDLLMSVVATTRANGVNVWEYLLDAMRHADEVRREPEAWLPWAWAARQRAPSRAAAAAAA